MPHEARRHKTAVFYNVMKTFPFLKEPSWMYRFYLLSPSKKKKNSLVLYLQLCSSFHGWTCLPVSQPPIVWTQGVSQKNSVMRIRVNGCEGAGDPVLSEWYSDSWQRDAEVTCQCTKHVLKHPQAALGYLDVTLLTTVGAKQILGRGMQFPSCHPPCGSGRYCFYCIQQLVL